VFESLVRPTYIHHSQQSSPTHIHAYPRGKKLAKKKAVSKIHISEHVLIPKHTKLSDKDKKALFEKYNISVTQLPKISLEDPAIRNLGVKIGDVIKITRKSITAGESFFYRGVVDV